MSSFIDTFAEKNRLNEQGICTSFALFPPFLLFLFVESARCFRIFEYVFLCLGSYVQFTNEICCLFFFGLYVHEPGI